MNGLLHISDTHFGTERPEVVDGLLALVRERSPRLVLLSGDVTQRATPRQFAAARHFVAALDCPRHLVMPGNHDISLNPCQRLLRPYARFRSAFGPALNSEYVDDDVMVLGLNTTRPWRHTHGEVSATQLAATGARLASATARQLRIVVTHQPVAVTLAEDEVNRLRGHARAVRAWAEQGADLVLGGHIHLPYWLPLHEAAPLARKLWAVQAGTATSWRLRGGTDNSVNELDWQTAGPERHCRITRWDWHPGARAFQMSARATLTLESPA